MRPDESDRDGDAETGSPRGGNAGDRGDRMVGAPIDKASDRAPYGRRRGRDGGFPERRYDDESYYSRPAMKASHWGWPIAGYYFAGGLAGAAQVLATVADLVGAGDDRTIVRGGRYISLAALLVSPPLLIADLHTPARFYNMLRIVRPTSAMSIGSWTLTGFGAFATLAALAQGLDDRTGHPAARATARGAGVPAGLLGLVMATYTGALSASTGAPLLAAVPRALPTLFGFAASASALAALTLYAEATGAPEGTHHQIERLALVLGVGELAAHAALWSTWRARGVQGALDTPRLALAYRVGMVGLGAIVPTAIHAAQEARGQRSRHASLAAAAATLVGVFAERAVIVFGGNASARSATDYLRFTQPRAGRR
jgi:protein NrfD